MNISTSKGILIVAIVAAVVAFFAMQQGGNVEPERVIPQVNEAPKSVEPKDAKTDEKSDELTDEKEEIVVDTSDWVRKEFDGWSLQHPVQDGLPCEATSAFFICFEDFPNRPDGTRVMFTVIERHYRPEGTQKSDYPFSCGHDYETCLSEWRSDKRHAIDRPKTIAGFPGRELIGTIQDSLGEHEQQVVLVENSEGTVSIVIYRLNFSPKVDALFDAVLESIKL